MVITEQAVIEDTQNISRRDSKHNTVQSYQASRREKEKYLQNNQEKTHQMVVTSPYLSRICSLLWFKCVPKFTWLET
jgi:hypothetical protein